MKKIFIFHIVFMSLFSEPNIHFQNIYKMPSLKDDYSVNAKTIEDDYKPDWFRKKGIYQDFRYSTLGDRELSNQDIIKLSKKNQKKRNNDFTVIDIRNVDDCVKSGVIHSSVIVPFFEEDGSFTQDNFLKRLKERTGYKSKYHNFVLISTNGAASRKVAAIMKDEMGFKNVYNLKDGILGWILGYLPIKYFPKEYEELKKKHNLKDRITHQDQVYFTNYVNSMNTSEEQAKYENGGLKRENDMKYFFENAPDEFTKILRLLGRSEKIEDAVGLDIENY